MATRSGTSINLAISLDTARTLDEVLHSHSSSGEGHDFARTSVPLLLLAGGKPGALLASRADAKRALSRLADFGHAQMDFSGIAHVGHGFADEMFRVYLREHPQLDIDPVGMAAQVAAMVNSVRQQALPAAA